MSQQTTQKIEYSASDAQPIVLYAKSDPASNLAYPITKDFFMRGMYIPNHDTEVIDETNPNNVTMTYSLTGSTVAVKTVAKVGFVTTVSIVYF